MGAPHLLLNAAERSVVPALLIDPPPIRMDPPAVGRTRIDPPAVGRTTRPTERFLDGAQRSGEQPVRVKVRTHLEVTFGGVGGGRGGAG